ncbi:MAG: 30S ribosomal protein S3 [Candidatus Acetothermia bacterium]|nr:30S ribosomal protein S3 [Candidatus Bipolaricaulota bacterium]
MGQKVNPVGFRVGVNKKWESNWYSDDKTPEFIAEDRKIRDVIEKRYRGAGIAKVSIERPRDDKISIIIVSARPGIIIGKGGSEINGFQAELTEMTDREVNISIKEAKEPHLQAQLIAQEVAFQIENRLPPNRAMKEVISRSMSKGAKGVKIKCSGRIGGANLSRTVSQDEGRIPLQTIRADIDYGFIEARTKYGPIGVKAWVFREEILPEGVPEGLSL